MIFKKLMALVLTLVMVLSVAGCGSKDVSWAAKLGDEQVPAGIYVLNVMAGLNAASMKAADGVTDFLGADIDGKTGAQFVADYAKDETRRQLAIHDKFLALGLSITDAEKTNYENYAKDMYKADADMYKANGISEQSVIDYNRYSFEAYQVFQKTYGAGGEKAATAEEMVADFASKYNLAYVVVYLKVDPATGAPLEGDALAAVNTKADADYKAIQDGKNIADVIYENDLAQLVAGAEKPVRAQDSYYMMAVDKVDSGNFPPFMTAHLAQAATDSLAMIEDETFKLIVKKTDETKVDPALAESYYMQSLPQMKQEDFYKLALSWADALSINYNDAALAHYTGAKVKKETDAYMAAQSSSAAAAAPSSLPADASTPGNEPAPSASDSGSAPAESTPASASASASTAG